MSENIIDVNENTFEAEVLQSDIPVLVDFWAEWCGPCKMVAPILEEIAREYSGKTKIVKVNVDENAKLATNYNIRGIPTLILFKAGKMSVTKVGAMSKAQLLALLQANP